MKPSCVSVLAMFPMIDSKLIETTRARFSVVDGPIWDSWEQRKSYLRYFNLVLLFASTKFGPCRRLHGWIRRDSSWYLVTVAEFPSVPRIPSTVAFGLAPTQAD